MSSFAIWGGVLLSLVLTTVAIADPTDPYKITTKEKAACTTDAIRLCAFTYPDESKLLACMKSNRTSLSPLCLVAFDAGLKRRRLN